MIFGLLRISDQNSDALDVFLDLSRSGRMTQRKVGWRLEHHFYPQIVSVDVLYLLVAVCCKLVTAVEDVRHQAELIEVTMESSTAEAPFTILHIHSPLSYSAHIRTFDFHLAAFSQTNSYTKEVELLNNFV